MQCKASKMASCKYSKRISKITVKDVCVCAKRDCSSVSVRLPFYSAKQNCSQQFYTNRMTTRDIQLSVMFIPPRPKDDFL